MNLTRLVYYSVRNPSMSIEIPKLINTCNRINGPMNVSGILHYNNNAFLQVLEGHRPEVSAIYHRIATDPRHMNIVLIQCGEVAERMFPYWSMALHKGMDEQTKSVFLRYFGSTLIDPNTVDSEDLLKVLQELATGLPRVV